MRWFKRWFNRLESSVLSDEDFIAVIHAAGVRTEQSRNGSWRCGGPCSRMQHSGSLQAWLPDYTMAGDPMWAILERCRRMQYNGQFTAWCLSCCRSLKPMTPEEMIKYDKTPHDPIPTFGMTMGNVHAGARPFVQGMTLGPGESAVMRIPLSLDAVDPHAGTSSD